MSDKTLKNEARNYYVPYLLGNSKKAHGLSLRIYKKFGIISVICDSRRISRASKEYLSSREILGI